MTEKNYIKLIAGHFAIGFLIFLFPPLAKLYAFSIAMFGFYFIVKNKNKNNEVFYAAAYVVGSEVFLRTTFGNPIHEYGKYFVMLFMFLGMFYSGITKKINPYWVYLLLLIPSVLIGFYTIDFDVRKKIIFDILGPVTLGICSLYTYKRKITTLELNNILLALGLPVIACCTFLFLKYPIDVKVILNTESNYYLSGNYAPNQMATVLGLGTFVFFLRMLVIKTSNKILALNILITSCIYYRGLMTFSRGGTITGIAMVLILLFFVYINHKKHTPVQLKYGLMCLIFPAMFVLGSYQTDGLLLKRYINQNPSGTFKSHEVNGREDMAMEEIELFKENPGMGIGVGEVKEIRKTEQGISVSSHNEVTRLLAEHGILGLFSLMILIGFPVLIYFGNKQNFYLFSFFAFWLLTVNHSGMRIAAPAFVYALTLFSLKKDKETGVSSI